MDRLLGGKWRLGREADGESVLRAAIAASPQDAGHHHALGLALVRLKPFDEALGELPRHLNPIPIRRDMLTSMLSRSTQQDVSGILWRISR